MNVYSVSIKDSLGNADDLALIRANSPEAAEKLYREFVRVVGNGKVIVHDISEGEEEYIYTIFEGYWH